MCQYEPWQFAVLLCLLAASARLVRASSYSVVPHFSFPTPLQRPRPPKLALTGGHSSSGHTGYRTGSLLGLGKRFLLLIFLSTAEQ